WQGGRGGRAEGCLIVQIGQIMTDWKDYNGLSSLSTAYCVRSWYSSYHAIWMASSLPSVDYAASSTNVGKPVISLCRSVKRTSRGFCSGYRSASFNPISSASSQRNSSAMLSLSVD